MFFAFPYALFPFVADDLDARGRSDCSTPRRLVGALLATLTSGWTNHVHHHGRAIVYGRRVWGAAIALFGLAPDVWWALLVLLMFAGASTW